MGRYTGPKERLSRREGLNLGLKGMRSSNGKDGMTRKPYAPGQHGAKGGSKLSNYGVQLREKQKVKRVYGVRERQFKNYYLEATRKSKVNNSDRGLEMLQLLEMRLDNVVYLLGFAPSRAAARQYVSHKHVMVNDKVINIASHIVSVGDVIKLKKATLKPAEAEVSVKKPEWIETSKDSGKILDKPTRDMIDEGIRENLIIEFYSR